MLYYAAMFLFVGLIAGVLKGVQSGGLVDRGLSRTIRDNMKTTSRTHMLKRADFFE